MDPTRTPALSPSSLLVSESNRILDDAIAELVRRSRPIATRPDGRQQFQLPNGVRVVLSPQRQAKKHLVESEQLSARQYKKRRKQHKREQQAQLASP